VHELRCTNIGDGIGMSGLIVPTMIRSSCSARMPAARARDAQPASPCRSMLHCRQRRAADGCRCARRSIHRRVDHLLEIPVGVTFAGDSDRCQNTRCGLRRVGSQALTPALRRLVDDLATLVVPAARADAMRQRGFTHLGKAPCSVQLRDHDSRRLCARNGSFDVWDGHRVTPCWRDFVSQS